MKDDKIYIKYIIEALELIEQYVKGIDEKGFFSSFQVQDAVIRRLEIIGEAAKNISKTFKEKYSDIPWKEMAGMRDILIHEYFGVDLLLVWNTIKKDLPKLKESIKKAMENGIASS